MSELLAHTQLGVHYVSQVLFSHSFLSVYQRCVSPYWNSWVFSRGLQSTLNNCQGLPFIVSATLFDIMLFLNLLRVYSLSSSRLLMKNVNNMDLIIDDWGTLIQLQAGCPAIVQHVLGLDVQTIYNSPLSTCPFSKREYCGKQSQKPFWCQETLPSPCSHSQSLHWGWQSFGQAWFAFGTLNWYSDYPLYALGTDSRRMWFLISPGTEIKLASLQFQVLLLAFKRWA